MYVLLAYHVQYMLPNESNAAAVVLTSAEEKDLILPAGISKLGLGVSINIGGNPDLTLKLPFTCVSIFFSSTPPSIVRADFTSPLVEQATPNSNLPISEVVVTLLAVTLILPND